jgi:hypothetical protein
LSSYLDRLAYFIVDPGVEPSATSLVVPPYRTTATDATISIDDVMRRDRKLS